MQGTVITDVKIYNELDSKLAWQAVAGDRVDSANGDIYISRLWRNGVKKLDGHYVAGSSGCVRWDEVTPPPDPTGPTLTHVIKVYSDGSIDVDGTPYP